MTMVLECRGLLYIYEFELGMIREREIQGCALKDPRTCEGELKSLKA
jgi:hypothetical protein